MKKLKDTFTKNDLHFQLVKRTDTVAMYQLFTRETDTPSGYEVWDIPMQKENTRVMPDGNVIFYEYGERVIANEEFGLQYRSKAFMRKDLADKWYDILTTTLPGSVAFIAKQEYFFRRVGLKTA